MAVEFHLWDVFAGEQMRGLRFDAPEGQWRRIAHKIADVIYERLTGEPGYFDTRIAYIAESGPATKRVKRVAIMDQDGNANRYLTDGSFLALTPRFSPDGGRIAYMAYRGGPPRIYTIDVASGRSGVLGDFPGMTFAPRFAPDGRSLLLTLAQNGNSDIYLWDIASRRATRLTNDAAIDTSPSFSPDGSRIVFNSDRGGRPLLYVMDRSGGCGRPDQFRRWALRQPRLVASGRPDRVHGDPRRDVQHRGDAPRRQRRATDHAQQPGREPDMGAQWPRNHVQP